MRVGGGPIGLAYDGRRVDLYPSDTPRFMPQTTPVDLAVDLGRSRVTLPTLERTSNITLAPAG